MTVNEMIERLQEVAEEGFGECELRLAFQPRWPLQFVIGGVATPDDESRGMGEPDEERDDEASVVYLTEGDHPSDDSPYAPSWVFTAAR
ncbi:MAG: hypothetical protein KAY32_17145 [Candidatus Eisenbacteria sp.]|nr:hypothetical protein [Candidatus Eisenbacteria bacterium]